VVLLLVPQELEKQNLLKLSEHNLENLYLFSTVMKHLMEMQWVEFLLVFVKLELGVVSTNLTDLKNVCLAQ
jgi:hypothetical protein